MLVNILTAVPPSLERPVISTRYDPSYSTTQSTLQVVASARAIVHAMQHVAVGWQPPLLAHSLK